MRENRIRGEAESEAVAVSEYEGGGDNEMAAADVVVMYLAYNCFN